MSRHPIFRTIALLCCCAAGTPAVAPAAVASADAGGSQTGAATAGSAQSGGASSSGQPTSGPQPQPAGRRLTAQGDGITFSTIDSGVLHHTLSFSGQASGVRAGARIEIERRGQQTHWRWMPTAHGTTDSSGGFTAVWPVNHIGRFALRAIIVGGGSSRSASASPSVTVTIFRPSVATIYGPGFYGQRTACGEILRPNTIGVANRTLPCGTKVDILYAGRTLVVPVIDRGPYANGADWDLTEATARTLGADGTIGLGAVSLPRSG